MPRWWVREKTEYYVNPTTGETGLALRKPDVGTYSGGFAIVAGYGPQWLVDLDVTPTGADNAAIRSRGGQPEVEGKPADPDFIRYEVVDEVV